MAESLPNTLESVPLRNVKAELLAGESQRQKVTADGFLVELAMNRAGLEAKQLAGAMDVSLSFLLRGFKDHEHISWQRLQRAGRVFPIFKRHFLEVQAEETPGADVTTNISLRKTL